MSEKYLYDSNPIPKIIVDSILDYRNNLNRKLPKAMEQLMSAPDLAWEFAGFDNPSCEYWVRNKKTGELITFNYKTNELLSVSPDYKTHKYYSPKQGKWFEYTPEESKHYNRKTDKFEYYNIVTGEWLGENGIVEDGSNYGAHTYTVKYDKKEKAFRYNNSNASAIYIVDKGVWGIFDKNSKRKAYFDLKTGKELVIDKNTERMIPREVLERQKAEQQRKIDDILYEVRQKRDKANNNDKKKPEETQLTNQKTGILKFFENIKNWILRKFKKFSGSLGIRTKADKDKIIYRSRQIYRSPETIAKMQEKENNKKKLKLKVENGLKYFDDKKRICAGILVGIAALGMEYSISRSHPNATISEDKTVQSMNIDDMDIDKEDDIIITEETKPAQKIVHEEKSTIKENNKEENDDIPITFLSQKSEDSAYYIPAGTDYYSSSSKTGEKGKFANNIEVDIFNRAIVRMKEDGTSEILLGSSGQTWEEYAKKSGTPIEEIQKLLNESDVIEMIAIQKPNTERNLSNTFGWVEASEIQTIARQDLEENEPENDR